MRLIAMDSLEFIEFVYFDIGDMKLPGSEMMIDTVQHKFAFTNGIRMHYVEAGTGPLVLLCHGWPESWYSWRHQIPALTAAGFRVIAPDLRGYGDTEAPASIEEYDILHLVSDLVGLVHAAGEERAIFVGHDWGSAIAGAAAMLRPVCTENLIRVDGVMESPKLAE